MKHTVRTSVFHWHLNSAMLIAVAPLRRSRHWFARHYIYYDESFDDKLFCKLVRQDAILNSYESNFIYFVFSMYL